ncbi:MAG: Ig-like domain-containing protein [Phycisphaerales bacterium JB039]
MLHLKTLLCAICVICGCCLGARAEIIPVRELELAGKATVTASTWDIGHKDHLFDQDWSSLYRSAAVNPAVITVAFDAPTAVGAARAQFSAGDIHEWTLEAADTLADLDSKSGSYALVFGPIWTDFPGVQWTEFNDTPVERRIFRFSVKRLTRDDFVHIYELELQSPEPVEEIQIGGETVRINIIETKPETVRLPVGDSAQLSAEASLSYGPDRYDVTSLVEWRTLDPFTATVTRTGRVTGVRAGQTRIAASIGLARGETTALVRSRRPVDLDVGWIGRDPAYNRFKVDYTGDQKIHAAYLDEQKWPAPGELVTWRAHVFNKGDDAAADVAYRWLVNGAVVDSGVIANLGGGEGQVVELARPWPADEVQTIAPPPGAQEFDPPQLERAIGGNVVRFELDPADQIAEITELNNAVDRPMGAVAFWFFMEESTYERFSNTLNFLETYSPEDWLRMQLVGLQRRLRVAGAMQQLAVDNVVVVPDGELSPGGTHAPKSDPEVRPADGVWGFVWPQDYIDRYVKVVENALAHELGHQIGMIDVYQYDIATDNCLITRGGSRVAGSALMPLVSPWNVYYGNLDIFHAGGQAFVDDTRRGLMAGPGARYVGPGSAAGMQRNLGLRRGFFGDYLAAIPQGDITLRVVEQGGAPVANCAVRVFQRDLNGTVPDVVKFSGTTDAGGQWLFPPVTRPEWKGGVVVNNPWSWKDGAIIRDTPDAVGRNAPLIIELEFGGTVEYHFVDVDTANLAVAGGITGDWTLTLTTYASRAGNRLPEISLGGAPDVVVISEDEVFETTISAVDPDGDDVTLGATPLYGSTFDPATGRFTFRPDSLQVNVHPFGVEGLSVTFTADDGKFRSLRRIEFQVRDVPGFAVVREPELSRCFADCDGDGSLTFFDFLCFQNQFGLGEPAADCDGDGSLTFFDFLCFQNEFAAGCG